MIPYVLIIVLSLVLAEANFKGRYIFRYVALAGIIIFVGIRYDVGADYLSYENIFKDSSDLGIAQVMEPGYLKLNQLVRYFSTNFAWFTTLVIFLQAFFIHLAIKDFKYYTFALLIFITTVLGSIVNEMRQYIAVAIFFYSLKYIVDKSFFKYSIVILFAASFHYSAILLLPLYFFLNRRLPYSYYPLLYILAIIAGMFGVFDRVFSTIMQYTMYSAYLDSDMVDEVRSNTGLGYLFKNLLGIIILLCFKPILEKFPQYKVYCNLYFCFLLCRNLFFSIGILMRLTMYFQISEIVIYPMFIYSVIKTKFLPDAVIVLSAILLILFFSAIANPDNHLYYQTIK